MIETPFTFFEVKKEEFLADSAQFSKAKLRIAPKALNAIDVVLAPGKLVFVMVDASVFVAAKKQTVVAEPAIGVNRCLGKHLAFDNRLQLCSGAVFDHAGEDLAAALQKPDHRVFSRRSATSFSPHPPRTKVGFINIDLAL